MSANRELTLRSEILRALDQCGGYLLPEPTLLNELRLCVAPPPVESEFTAAIRFLEAQKLIAGIRPELGGPVKWSITDRGRLQLNQ